LIQQIIAILEVGVVIEQLGKVIILDGKCSKESYVSLRPKPKSIKKS